MNIRRQLQLIAGSSFTVVLIVCITLFLSLRDIDVALEKSTFAGEVNTNGVSGLRTVTVDFIVGPQGRALLQWQQRHSSLQALLATDMYAGTPEQAIVERLRQRSAYLGEIFPKLTRSYTERSYTEGSGSAAQIGLRREVQARLLTQIMVATQDMVTDANELMHRSLDYLGKVQRRANLVVAIVVAVMCLLVIANLVLAVRHILNPIRTLQRGAEIIGAGDLSYRTDITLDNEIGALSRAFDAMALQLARSQAALEANAWRLEESVKELESFSYSVSHDLRAPLRGIDGWSLALQEDYGARLDETGRKYLDTVRAEAQRMGHLIEDLLQLSRVTRGELRREPVDLSALAQNIAGRLKDAHPERQIEFLIEPGLVAHADPRLIEIALTNLLDNACKFTGTRSLARIEVGRAMEQDAKAKTQRNVFFVRDNGVGFDMAHAARLFGAFQRLHSTSEFPGTGIGLATVQRIVRRHGGRIWAEAQADQGASFYFTLEEA